MEMENVFKSDVPHNTFVWENLGDTSVREDLGDSMPVTVYRLMQFTMLDVLSKEYGVEKANECFRDAGFLAGSEFAKNILDLKVEFNTFVANLQKSLQELKIGILRMEAFDPETGEIVLAVDQDLDCSGLPITNENVCSYDEGFIAGILEVYTGKKYRVREIDCWASGARTCRFSGTVEQVD